MGSRVRNHRLSDAAGPDPALPRRPQPLSSGFRLIAAAFRLLFRSLVLFATLSAIAASYLALSLRRGPRLTLADRALWLHLSCRAVLRRMGVRLQCRGPRPASGLICSNHLSYLDIAVCAAAAPCVFVSKLEVSRWPLFGFFARAGGTIFIDRHSRASTDSVAQQIAATLATGVAVLLFPEGTSTDGVRVLRFHPSLLEPAVRSQTPIAPAALAYRAPHVPERDLCWFGDAAFLPHLLRTLARSGLEAIVEFYPRPAEYSDRKAAALDLQAKVEALRTRMKRESAEDRD